MWLIRGVSRQCLIGEHSPCNRATKNQSTVVEQSAADFVGSYSGHVASIIVASLANCANVLPRCFVRTHAQSMRALAQSLLLHSEPIRGRLAGGEGSR